MQAADTVLGRSRPTHTGSKETTRRSRAFYVWVLVVLAVAVVAVILGWHAKGGTTDPTALAPGQHMSRTTAVINSGILVFREGLETILVLAAITASFLGANKAYRRPVAAGGGLALAGRGRHLVSRRLGHRHVRRTRTRRPGRHRDPSHPGAVGGDELVLPQVYWTGWISHHHKRRRAPDRPARAGGRPRGRALRRTMLGLGLLGFTSVYREGFEVVIFLQNLRLAFGSSVVLEGVLLGLLFTGAVGVLTFALHQRLPYKRLLIITGAMLLVVLFVMVGEEINEMQLAGWIGTTTIPWLHFPGWTGTWLSLFGNVQTIVAQALAITLVVGSYVAAQYMRVWRPRRQGRPGARIATRPPQSAPLQTATASS